MKNESGKGLETEARKKNVKRTMKTKWLLKIKIQEICPIHAFTAYDIKRK